jgi:hypothetical protein
MEKPRYRFHLEDLGGIFPYAKRNEFEDGTPYQKLMRRALPLALYTIVLAAIPFVVWRGLEKLVKKRR